MKHVITFGKDENITIDVLEEALRVDRLWTQDQDEDLRLSTITLYTQYYDADGIPVTSGSDDVIVWRKNPYKGKKELSRHGYIATYPDGPEYGGLRGVSVYERFEPM